MKILTYLYKFWILSATGSISSVFLRLKVFKRSIWILALPVLSFGLLSMSIRHYSERQVADFVREVYSDKADALVLKGNSNRLHLITDFLERTDILLASPETKRMKGIRLLSEVPLNNKYNPALQRDGFADPSKFNPLKYQLQMFSKRQEIYRIDPTNYVIVIQPINSGK